MQKIINTKVYPWNEKQTVQRPNALIVQVSQQIVVRQRLIIADFLKRQSRKQNVQIYVTILQLNNRHKRVFHRVQIRHTLILSRNRTLLKCKK